VTVCSRMSLRTSGSSISDSKTLVSSITRMALSPAAALIALNQRHDVLLRDHP
jgi:hypothetical protein